MFILIIEDNENTIKGIKDEFISRGDHVEVCNFTDFQEKIKRTDIDVVIADWKDDETDKGEDVLECIYSAFVPTIIFSAIADTLGENIAKKQKTNPFLVLISKGDEEPVINKIKEWEKYIALFKDVKKNMNGALLSAIAALKLVVEGDEIERNVLSYHLNRRAANYLLENSIDGEDTEGVDKLTPAWMEYDYPSTSKSLLVADLLVKEDGHNRSYYVVLTPSCDMARLDEDKSKKKQIIVAKCTCGQDILKGMASIPKKQDTEKKKNDFVEKAVKKIREVGGSLIALPEIPNVMPCLTVNYKDLELFTHYEIALSEEEYKTNKERYKYFRITSIESPFREQIVWGYMICSCRPGVPERNYNKWAEGFINDSN